MKLSQRIANQVFKQHGPYQLNNGELRMAPQPTLKHGISRLGFGILSAATTVESAVLAYAAETTQDSVSYAGIALSGLAGVAIAAYDHLNAANNSLPNTVEADANLAQLTPIYSEA